jgi:hypothetical protein
MKFSLYLNRLTKLPLEYYIVIFLFIIVIFMSIYGNTFNYLGNNDTKTLHMYPFENFTSGFSHPAQSAASVSGKETNVLEDSKGVLGVFEADGLKAAPVDAPPLFDPVSKLKGSPNCTGISNGYSNSLGGLCFTEDVQKLFQTRGTN